MTLIAGVDSSTQSCKVVVHDADSGELVREGSAPHPDGTEVDPARWWDALQQAIDAAGGLDDVAALAVGGQQHGMVCLDDGGAVVRDALLWNDTRSAGAAEDLIAELPGGAAGWAEAVGTVPVASITAAKLRWLATHEPDNAARSSAVCLPHDWLTWRLLDRGDIDGLVTDRGDASGTGYWSTPSGGYRADLLELSFGRSLVVPRVLAPAERAGVTAAGVVVGPGTGDNAGAALGLGARPGDVVVSIGTSGVVSAVSDTATTDASGTVAGFADATGRYLPMTVTLNAARVLSATARLLDVDLDRLAGLALDAPSGADGLVLVPYFEGERTPNRPDATATLHGLTLASSTPAHLARAAVEGLLCGLADGLDALVEQGARVERVLLIGGGARSIAVRRLAPALFGVPVLVPEPAEYVARGAARQAAWTLADSSEPPQWNAGSTLRFEAEPTPAVRERYAEVRDLTSRRH